MPWTNATLPAAIRNRGLSDRCLSAARSAANSAVARGADDPGAMRIANAVGTRCNGSKDAAACTIEDRDLAYLVDDRRALTKHAAGRSFGDVERAISESMNNGRGDSERLWPREIYDDWIVYADSGRHYQRPYQIDDAGAVTFGDPTEVIQTWAAKSIEDRASAAGITLAGDGEREIKTFGDVQIKLGEESAGGYKTLEGYVSTFGAERAGGPALKHDLQGDCVDPGAFALTIDERVKAGKVKMLTDHVWSVPTTMGTFRHAEEDSKGLLFKADLIQRVAWVQDAAEAAAQGHVSGLSMGYETMRRWFEDRAKDLGKTIRHLSEVKLFEGSLTPFPADEDSAVLGLKSNRAATLALAQLDTLADTLRMAGKAASREDVAIIRDTIAKLEAWLSGSDGSTAPAGTKTTQSPDADRALLAAADTRLALARREALERYGVQI